MMDVSEEVFMLSYQHLRKVRRSGSENIMAICPFHLKSDGTEEQNPSFAMSLTNGLFFCHACKAKGNLYTFLRDLGLTRQVIELKYRDLIEAASNNIPAPPDPMRPGVFELQPMDEAMLGLFDHDTQNLLPNFAQSTLQHFDVGWDGWHKRITFPLRDLKGKLVGISGRAVYGEQWPKYKVYDSEYQVWHYPPRHGWDKRALLWNANSLYPDAFGQSPADAYLVIVEGFKAAMWLWQCGIRNVVALLGSYLSWEQQWILERLGARVYIFTDNDGPGRQCNEDAAHRLSKVLSTHIIEYPTRLLGDEDAQPDDLTPSEASEQLARAPIYEQWLMSNQEKHNVIR